MVYAAEALDWNSKSEKSVQNAYLQAFFKMFKTYDKHIIQQCQFYMGCLPVHLLIDLRKLTFLHGLHVNIETKMSLLHHLAKWTDLDFDRLKLKWHWWQNKHV